MPLHQKSCYVIKLCLPVSFSCNTNENFESWKWTSSSMLFCLECKQNVVGPNINLTEEKVVRKGKMTFHSRKVQKNFQQRYLLDLYPHFIVHREEKGQKQQKNQTDFSTQRFEFVNFVLFSDLSQDIISVFKERKKKKKKCQEVVLVS